MAEQTTVQKEGGEGGGYWDGEDEFEEFEGAKGPQPEAGERAAKAEAPPLWEEDWNDQDVGEDFIVKLKREQQAAMES